MNFTTHEMHHHNFPANLPFFSSTMHACPLYPLTDPHVCAQHIIQQSVAQRFYTSLSVSNLDTILWAHRIYTTAVSFEASSEESHFRHCCSSHCSCKNREEEDSRLMFVWHLRVLFLDLPTWRNSKQAMVTKIGNGGESGGGGEEKRAHQFRRLLRLLRQFEDLNILFQLLALHS